MLKILRLLYIVLAIFLLMVWPRLCLRSASA